MTCTITASAKFQFVAPDWTMSQLQEAGVTLILINCFPMSNTPLIVAIPPFGELKFEVLEQFLAWLADERSFWSFLEGKPGRVADPTLGRLNTLHTLAMHGGGNGLASQESAIRATLSSYIQDGLYSKSPLGQFIAGLKQTNPQSAEWATAMILNVAPSMLGRDPNGWINRDHFGALVGAAMQMQGWLPPEAGLRQSIDTFIASTNDQLAKRGEESVVALRVAQEARKSIEEFRSATQQDMETDKTALKTDLKKALNDTTAAHANALRLFSTRLDGLLKSMDETLNGAEKQIDTALTNTKDELNAITKTYDEKMALAAPVAYWTNRRNWHLGLAIGFGLTFFGTLSVAGYLLVTTYRDFLPDTVSADAIPLGRIAESAVVLMLSVWVLRTLARVFFSNLHLGIDAGQRAIMVQTYLALLREQAGLDADGKKLMIEAMFRPTSTGIVKDDANPPWAWMAAFKGKE